MQAAAPPSTLREAFSKFIETRLGLHFPSDRWNDLERGMAVVATELGFAGAQEAMRWLLSAPVARAELDLLAVHLTVGETYFFRDPKAFEVLEKVVLPKLIRARRGSTPHLRLWSAGCCTGEEPYSMAIALCRALPDLEDWQVTILGTDLNPRFLQKAAEATYGRWSFRGVPEAVREEFFSPLPNGRFELVPKIRRLVTFTSVNFVEDAYPSLVNHTQAMDVIFCRNVLMYFSREQMSAVLARLHRSLVEGGWLFTSASEASRELLHEFAPAELEVPGVFRKGAPVLRRDALPRVPDFSQDEDAPERIPPGTTEAQRARTLANEGRLSEALAVCDTALAADKLDAHLHYLRGMILEEQGVFEDAITSLRRALYLDPDFIVAYFSLGNSLRRHGRTVEADRCFENARTLLAPYARDAELPGAEGLTAGRLLAILLTLRAP